MRQLIADGSIQHLIRAHGTVTVTWHPKPGVKESAEHATYPLVGFASVANVVPDDEDPDVERVETLCDLEPVLIDTDAGGGAHNVSTWGIFRLDHESKTHPRLTYRIELDR